MSGECGKHPFDWFAQNPLNYYECTICEQWEKGHGDPRDTLISDRCSRCCGVLKIREGHEMRLPRQKWNQ